MLGIDWSALVADVPVQALDQWQRHQLATVRSMVELRLLEMERTSGMAQRLLMAVPRKEFNAFSALDEYHQWRIINDLVTNIATFWFGEIPKARETLVDN